jgi:hypothetical protein
MFNDERVTPGNPQVYCQRFRADRSRISGNQQVSGPNLFPNDQHWSVGQSIAASADAVAFAWTGNRRHQGWDIVAKVTDWDLIGIGSPKDGDRSPRRMVLGPTVTADGHFVCSGPPGTTLGLFDVTGRELASSLTGTLMCRIPDAGAYFVLVQDGGHVSSHKVVVPRTR